MERGRQTGDRAPDLREFFGFSFWFLCLRLGTEKKKPQPRKAMRHRLNKHQNGTTHTLLSLAKGPGKGQLSKAEMYR